MGRNQVLGAKGEELVSQFVSSQGYKILERNWRIKEGEIDLIALSKSGQITFIEVKTRSSEKFGHPLEAISRDKAHRLQKLALAWLVLNGKFGSDYQIDCASVLFSDGKYEIDYRKSII